MPKILLKHHFLVVIQYFCAKDLHGREKRLTFAAENK